MFTGLVQRKGNVAGMDRDSRGGVRLVVECPAFDRTPEPGDSICVSGCCLTLAEPAEESDGGQTRLAFDVIPESLDRTTLGELELGSAVNLETSCTPTTLMGGHVVQGHVEGVGEIASIDETDGYVLRVRPPKDLMPAITPKGSITIEGISLTIADVDVKGGTFSVALIPTTLRETTIGQARARSRVNLETDILARTVVHYLRHFGGPGD